MGLGCLMQTSAPFNDQKVDTQFVEQYAGQQTNGPAANNEHGGVHNRA